MRIFNINNDNGNNNRLNIVIIITTTRNILLNTLVLYSDDDLYTHVRAVLRATWSPCCHSNAVPYVRSTCIRPLVYPFCTVHFSIAK